MVAYHDSQLLDSLLTLLAGPDRSTPMSPQQRNSGLFHALPRLQRMGNLFQFWRRILALQDLKESLIHQHETREMRAHLIEFENQILPALIKHFEKLLNVEEDTWIRYDVAELLRYLDVHDKVAVTALYAEWVLAELMQLESEDISEAEFEYMSRRVRSRAVESNLPVCTPGYIEPMDESMLLKLHQFGLISCVPFYAILTHTAREVDELRYIYWERNLSFKAEPPASPQLDAQQLAVLKERYELNHSRFVTQQQVLYPFIRELQAHAELKNPEPQANEWLVAQAASGDLWLFDKVVLEGMIKTLAVYSPLKLSDRKNIDEYEEIIARQAIKAFLVVYSFTKQHPEHLELLKTVTKVACEWTVSCLQFYPAHPVAY